MMGTDIHISAEKRGRDGQWCFIDADDYDHRNYALFGWLANIRNYSAIPPLASEAKGLPQDCASETAQFHEWNHSETWYSIGELCDFDYEQPVEDRRITIQTGPNSWDGGGTSQPGGGEMTTYRELFGDRFIELIHDLRRRGVERVIFSFDS